MDTTRINVIVAEAEAARHGHDSDTYIEMKQRAAIIEILAIIARHLA